MGLGKNKRPLDNDSMAFLIALLLSWNVSAGEPDNFSARRDSKAVVANAEINKAINGVLDMNLQEFPAKFGCDRKKFLDFVQDDLDRNLPQVYKAVYVNAPVAGPRFAREVPYRAGRPYTDLYFSQSYKVNIQGQTFYIGLDKIDHFFAHGATYWDMVGQDPALPKDKVKKALEVGVLQEQATWGLQRPGVKSYADLSANYQGLYFWRDLFDGKPAIALCQNGRFVKNREFKIEDYFVPSMDETINCNSYADQEMYQAIATVTKKWGQKCPAVEGLCEEMKSKNGEFASLLLHPRCLGTGTSQVEKASAMTTKDVLDTAQAVMGGGANYLLFKLFGEKKGQGVR
nr:hypothetical protein CKG001_09050 [Bdellovibrio sp. CKG001]